jgi:hypothetical protein
MKIKFCEKVELLTASFNRTLLMRSINREINNSNGVTYIPEDGFCDLAFPSGRSRIEALKLNLTDDDGSSVLANIPIGGNLELKDGRSFKLTPHEACTIHDSLVNRIMREDAKQQKFR